MALLPQDPSFIPVAPTNIGHPDEPPPPVMVAAALKPTMVSGPLASIASTIAHHMGPDSVAPRGPDSTPRTVELPPLSAEGLGQDRRYEVRSLLGKGGMGEVHLCHDQLVGRDVALKVVKSHGLTGSQPGLAARFLREARIQGQLEHPAIVPVYDLGSTRDGTAYFTMKRVRGMTLGEVLDSLSRGDPDTVATYSRRKLLTAFSSVCLAVDFAHGRGVIHRDLKPSNVMLGDYGEVYVLDWGLAKGPESAGGEEPWPQPAESAPHTDLRTVRGLFLGTPGYMAPEQARGDANALDPRSDVYALGAILFELLALSPLHPRADTATVLASTLNGVNGRPGDRAPDRDIPPELDAICERATSLDRNERFLTARALHQAVERFLDGDRDLTLRRTLAEDHAATAEAAAERALGPQTVGHNDRRMALRAVGQSLGLDPTNPVALRTLVRLLTDPPHALPTQAKDELAENAREQHRFAARIAFTGYLFTPLFVPLLFWMGIKDATSAVLCLALGLPAIALSFYISRARRTPAFLQHVLVILAAASIASMGRMFGPYILLPCLAIVNTLGFVIWPTRAGRAWFVLAGCLSVAVPALLEWTHLWDPSYLFKDGQMVLVPHMLGLGEVPTSVFLLCIHVGVIVGGSWAIGRLRDALTKAEERLWLQSWQLRQLIPEEAQGAAIRRGK